MYACNHHIATIERSLKVPKDQFEVMCAQFLQGMMVPFGPNVLGHSYLTLRLKRLMYCCVTNERFDVYVLAGQDWELAENTARLLEPSIRPNIVRFMNGKTSAEMQAQGYF